MLQLLSPAGLWALAALALPLAIHLWRPPPRTVLLGSLRFLDNLPHRRLRNLRWRERLLLAARLLLLAALALLLAGPRWRLLPPTGPQRWVLVDPTAAVSGDAASRLRRLRAEGFAMHRLAPGFPSLDSQASAASAEEPLSPPDLWSLLREADAALPAGSRLAVLTPGRAAALHGTRPALRQVQVDWIRTPDAAGTKPRPWIESLRWLVPAGTARKARALIGWSDAASTSFNEVFWPPSHNLPSNPAVEFSPDGNRVRLVSPSPGPWVRGDKVAPALRLVILHDPDRADDARNIEAAARAVAAVSGQPLAVTTHPLGDGLGPGQQPPAADWLFWLSARPVPAAVLAGTANVFNDAEAGPREIPAPAQDRIAAPSRAPGSGALAVAEVRLWRRVPAALPLADTVETLWTDGHGEPLLTLEPAAHGRRWRFYSRFHPDWTDLPRTAALPAVLGELLFPPPFASPTDAPRDLRLADPTQYSLSLSPAPAAVAVPVSLAPASASDLHWPLWLFAAALFAVERILSRPAASRPAPAVPDPAAALAR